MVGLVLLLITLAYGLTGYLLPWDNRAYWGTVVTTKIAASAPLAGPYLVRLMGGEGDVGVVTFARFYALHVLLLPPLTLILIGIHVYLVRKHGVATEPGDEARPKKRFYPGQVYRDTVAIFVAFAILFTMAVAVRVPLERLADPTDTSYIPRPDWYFLFLFQTLKFFEGDLEVVGSVILPNLAIVALFLVPFIDRTAMRHVRQRTLAVGVVALAALGWTGLTVAAVKTTPASPVVDVVASDGPEEWQQLTPETLAGIGYYRKENCAACHAGANKIGPDLVQAKNRDAAWLIAHFKRPSEVVPGSHMPPVLLSDSQLNTLAAFLLKLNAANAAALDSAPAFAVEGAMVYQQHKCGSCHQINGAGIKMGPPLNALAQRRSREWVEEHFVNPQKLSPGTVMPAYKFSSRDLDRITSYLMALP
jgi:ubiquinol-cytochrome c reductase cytochrome b subunit